MTDYACAIIALLPVRTIKLIWKPANAGVGSCREAAGDVRSMLPFVRLLMSQTRPTINQNSTLHGLLTWSPQEEAPRVVRSAKPYVQGVGRQIIPSSVKNLVDEI